MIKIWLLETGVRLTARRFLRVSEPKKRISVLETTLQKRLKKSLKKWWNLVNMLGETCKEFVQNENVMKTTISSKQPGKQSFSEVSIYLVSKIFLTISSDIKLTLQKRLEKFVKKRA